jgi:predicted outer membrane lipoprotein
MMKRKVTGILLGAAAGVIGIIVFELTDQQIWGWLTTAVLLGIASQFPHPAPKRRWLWLGALGGCIIVICYLLGRVVTYPIVVAWPLLGGAFGVICAPSGIGSRITGGGVGLLAGILGMGILPLITLLLLPALGLPTTFDVDMDMLGLGITGVFIGGTIAWLREK